MRCSAPTSWLTQTNLHPKQLPEFSIAVFRRLAIEALQTRPCIPARLLDCHAMKTCEQGHCEAVKRGHLPSKDFRIALLDAKAMRRLVFWRQSDVESFHGAPMTSGFSKRLLRALHVI